MRRTPRKRIDQITASVGSMKTLTEADEKVLRQINSRIVEFENAGDRKSLRALLATHDPASGPSVPVLAFRRASGACVDADGFLGTVSAGGDRRARILSIQLEGDHVALVRSVVVYGDKAFRNFRVFVRQDASGTDWRLLAWANEEHRDG